MKWKCPKCGSAPLNLSNGGSCPYCQTPLAPINATPGKILREITIADNRGTSITLRLFLSDLTLVDMIRELDKIWSLEFGGNSDSVTVDRDVCEFKPRRDFHSGK